MKKFKVGDIVVKRKFDENNPVYYIVVDIEDFSEENGEPEVDVEIMMIFPIEKMSRMEVVDQETIYPYSRADEKDNRTLLEFIGKEREKKGWFEEPEYIKAIKLYAKNSIKINKKPIEERHDIIYYHRIESIDECLDAINDLTALYKSFGDEAYLQLRDLMHKRIKELQS